MDLLDPATEPARTSARRRYGLPDVEAEPELHGLLRTAAAVCGVPTATLNLVDAEVQCNYATVGFEGGECALESSMCATALRGGGALHVPDAAHDPRFAASPWVTGELARIRLYASSPLLAPDGVALGTLCVFDERPHALSPAQLAVLDDLAAVVVALFERRRLALAAEQATRAKSAFLASVSHEVRTPLQGVLGMLDLLLGGPLEPVQRERAGVARRSAETLLGLLDGVLDLSKGEAGETVLAPRAFSPRVLVDDVVQVLRVLGTRKSVPLSWRTEGWVPDTVLADPDRVRQVLVNLVGNALKFTPAGEVEVVLVGPPGPQPVGRPVPLRLVVRDTGEGIAPDDLERLFAPFSQGEAGRRHGGTGLGLSISRSLVELMGGTLEVRSALGLGTEFTVTLVLPVAPDQQEQEQPAAPVARPGLRVLVADDDAVGRLVATALLESLGASATAVDDGEQALAAAATGAFDVVLLDYEMPGLSGPDTARRLRQDEPGLPVLGVTGRTSGADVQACRDAGMTEVLSKPLRADELAGVLARVRA